MFKSYFQGKNKELTTIFLIVFMDLFGFGIILPLLPYIAEQFSANPLQIGLLSAIYSFCQFLAAPYLGQLSDRYGRKKILILSQLGSAFGFLILGLAHSLPLLFLSRIIDGITGGNISIAQAYIADVTTSKNRARGMGLIGAAFGLGFILGPTIGGLLSQHGFLLPALISSGLALLTTLTTALFLKESKRPALVNPKTSTLFQKFKQAFSYHPLNILLPAFFFLSLGFSGLQGVFALWAQATLNWGPHQIGLLFGYIGLVAVITQTLIMPKITTSLGGFRTLKLSFLFITLGFLLIPLVNHPLVLYLANTLIVFGNSLANPNIQTIAANAIPTQEYGSVLGTLQSSASLGRIIGPALAGELYTLLGKDSPFLTAAIIIGLTGFYLLRHLNQKVNV